MAKGKTTPETKEEKEKAPAKKAAAKKETTKKEVGSYSEEQMEIINLQLKPTPEGFEEAGFKKYDQSPKGDFYEISNHKIKNIVEGSFVYNLNFERFKFEKAKHKATEKVFLFMPKI